MLIAITLRKSIKKFMKMFRINLFIQCLLYDIIISTMLGVTLVNNFELIFQIECFVILYERKVA